MPFPKTPEEYREAIQLHALTVDGYVPLLHPKADPDTPVATVEIEQGWGLTAFNLSERQLFAVTAAMMDLCYHIVATRAEAPETLPVRARQLFDRPAPQQYDGELYSTKDFDISDPKHPDEIWEGGLIKTYRCSDNAKGSDWQPVVSFADYLNQRWPERDQPVDPSALPDGRALRQ